MVMSVSVTGKGRDPGPGCSSSKKGTCVDTRQREQGALSFSAEQLCPWPLSLHRVRVRPASRPEGLDGDQSRRSATQGGRPDLHGES